MCNNSTTQHKQNLPEQLIKVWPAQSPPPWDCVETLSGHADAVTCLAVTQNHVFSASRDGMLHMWKLV